MHNPRLELLRDYPFQRLRDLLDPIKPKTDRKPISMSLGEPQHPFPEFVGEILHANRHLYSVYPPANGTPDFRQAAADWLNRRYDLPAGMIDPEIHVVPVTGTREGLFMFAQAVVPQSKNGQQPLVAMPNPFYQCYVGAAVIAGGEPLHMPSLAKNNFLPDLQGLDKAVLDRIALVYLCTPANPQGTIADMDYLKAAIRLARKHDFVLTVDECYAEIYDKEKPPGALQACAEMSGDMSNVVVFHSLSKRSSVPGLRSGFCAGDAAALAGLVKLRSYGAAGSSLPALAASAALWRDEAHVVTTRQSYRDKIDLAQNIIGNRYGFYRPPGGFFLWLDVGDGEAAARKLWEEAAVRVLPGLYLIKDSAASTEFGRPYIRIALVNDLATTRDALERIRDVL